MRQSCALLDNVMKLKQTQFQQLEIQQLEEHRQQVANAALKEIELMTTSDGSSTVKTRELFNEGRSVKSKKFQDCFNSTPTQTAFFWFHRQIQPSSCPVFLNSSSKLTLISIHMIKFRLT